MARRTTSLPDELDDRARRAGLDVSSLARSGIVAELDRVRRMAQRDQLLDTHDRRLGRPPDRVMDEARAWLDDAQPVDGAGSRSS